MANINCPSAPVNISVWQIGKNFELFFQLNWLNFTMHLQSSITKEAVVGVYVCMGFYRHTGNQALLLSLVQ